MDRQIVYPAQIPLDSDQLNAQRNAYVGLGQLAAMAYGWSTVAASGFACTAGTGLAVTIAPGSLLAPGVVDGTAYGTLAAVGSALVRQYVSRDPLTLAVPGAGATYTVYATPTTIDGDDTVLPFYNAADPAVTYAGADNSGNTAPTVRQDVVQVGIGTSVPAGAYPLWAITVPAGATSITADMIAQSDAAPFYDTIPQLQAAKQDALGFVPVSGQWAMGTTAYQVLGLTYLISAGRPQYFYEDGSGTQYAGGTLALESDVTSEASARESADAGLQGNINAEAAARASADAKLVSGVWAMGTTAYQITGLTYLISAGRPQYYYEDGSGNQYAGGTLALESDVTSEASARESADGILQNNINNEASARANAIAQCVSGVWAIGTTAYQITGLTHLIADGRPQYFYEDSSGGQHTGGELMLRSDVTMTKFSNGSTRYTNSSAGTYVEHWFNVAAQDQQEIGFPTTLSRVDSLQLLVDMGYGNSTPKSVAVNYMEGTLTGSGFKVSLKTAAYGDQAAGGLLNIYVAGWL